MSPRCSVMTFFDQKLTMYHTFFKFHWCYQKVCQTHDTSNKMEKSVQISWEEDTSMSPRCSEMTMFFQKWRMYHTIGKVFRPVPKWCSPIFWWFWSKKSGSTASDIYQFWKKVSIWLQRGDIDVTTLQRETYFFWKCLDVWFGLHGFSTPKIDQKSVSKAWYI